MRVLLVLVFSVFCVGCVANGAGSPEQHVNLVKELKGPIVDLGREWERKSRNGAFVGYDPFCGLPVIETYNPQGASASRSANGSPVIYIDPSILRGWDNSYRLFVFAHECGHHSLGHSTPQGMYFRNTVYWATSSQELAADCFAAQALASRGRTNDILQVARRYYSQGSYSPGGGYPSGQRRAFNMMECGGLL